MSHIDDELDIQPGRYRTEVPGDNDDFLDEEQVGFDIGRYSSEIVTVVVIAIIVAIIRHILPKRDRNGCTFFFLIFLVILYLVNKYVHF